MAATAVERVRKQRLLRKAAGWYEVKVWVTNEQEAQQIRDMATTFRQNHKNIEMNAEEYW